MLQVRPADGLLLSLQGLVGNAMLQARSPADMEDLSDEVLLRILSFVSDGETMLDSVPFVCKRWLALSREPQAWAGVDVAWTAADSGSAGPPVSARLLARAPALRRLRLDPTPEDPWLATALERCGADRLTEIEVCEDLWQVHVPAGVAGSALLDLVWRCRRRLRRLSLWLNEDALMESDAEGRCPLVVLAGLRGLRALQVYWAPQYDGCSYGGQLAAGLPALRELRVRAVQQCGPYEVLDDVPEALVVDLVRAAAATLRIFEHDSYRDVPPEELEVLAQCGSLRDVVANGTCVSAAQGWPCLESLTVRFTSGGVARFRAALLGSCAGLPALRRLVADVYPHPGQGAAARDEYGRHVAAFKTLRPGVVVLFRLH